MNFASPYTTSQLKAINVTERLGASLSVIGCTFVISTFLLSKRFRRPVNRIMFFASMSNLAYTVPGLIGLSGMKAGSSSALCQTQAFFVQAFLPSDAYWNLSMALNVYFTVFKANDMARLHQREPWYVGFNVLFPLAIAIIMVCITTPNGGRLYGSAGIWCWISSDWEWLRIATCYGPAWICIVSAFGIYIAAGLRIRRERLKLLRPSIENGQYGETHLADFDILAQTTVQTTVTADDTLQPPPTATSLKSPKNLAHKPSNRSRYQVHISTSAARPEGMVYSDPVRKYTKSCVLFFISLLMTWVPSSINRVYALASGGSAAPFGLAYTAALVLQFTGCWNSIVYITMSLNSCQELFQLDIFPWLRRKITGRQACPGTKSPLIWHGPGQDLPSRKLRRGSLDTTSSDPKTHPVEPPTIQTIPSPSQTETGSDSIASWDWGSSKKGLD